MYHKAKPLRVMLPKTSAYVKSYNGQTKCICFLIKVDELLEKYNTICDKFSVDIKKELHREPVCNKEFLKYKIKYRDNEDRDFYDEKFLRWNLIILV